MTSYTEVGRQNKPLDMVENEVNAVYYNQLVVKLSDLRKEEILVSEYLSLLALVGCKTMSL